MHTGQVAETRRCLADLGVDVAAVVAAAPPIPREAVGVLRSTGFPTAGVGR